MNDTDPGIVFLSDAQTNTAREAARDTKLFSGELLPGHMAIAGGTSATHVILHLKSLLARDGRSINSLSVDSDWSAWGTMATRTGEIVGFHPLERVALMRGHSRTEVHDLDRPELRAMFLGPGGLLDGVSVHEQYALPGLGSHALRPLAMVDYSLDARLRRRIRRALRHFRPAPPTQATGDAWTERPQAVSQEDEDLRPHVWIVGSISGSVGSTGLLLLPYLVRHEAKALGLPEPIVYGCLLGPELFRGLTDLVYPNAEATLRDLEAAFTSGFFWPLGNGVDPWIGDHLPPYWRVFYFDDPAAAEHALSREGEEGVRTETVSQFERDAFFRQVATSMYLAMTSDALVDFERTTGANSHPRPWAVMRGALADLHLPSLREAVVAVRTAESLRAVATSRGT